MALLFPKPEPARPCPDECGVPVVKGEHNGKPVTVHAGTWQAKCTPERKGGKRDG